MKQFYAVLIIFAIAAASGTAFCSDYFFSDVRIATEKKNENLLVREMLVLKPVGEKDFSNPEGIFVTLPNNAFDIALAEGVLSEQITITQNAILIEGPIPVSGRQAAVMFLVPINNGVALISRSLGTKAELVHAAYVGQENNIELSGPGFSKNEKGTTPTGIPALFMVGRKYEDGEIRIIISGFRKNLVAVAALPVVVISFFILAIGFFIWIRNRKNEQCD